MANTHRTNALVTSCLKTPVDPHTKAPLASYERERALPSTAAGHVDNRDHEKELEYDDSGSDFCDEDCLRKGGLCMMKDYRTTGDDLDLSEIFFSNEEYYSKLEELKAAHLRTMAELESMYRQKLQLKAMEPLDTGHRLLWANSRPAASGHLRKSQSAVELWRGSGHSSDNEEDASNNVEKGLLFSPKEHIKNMWQDFKLSPHHRHPSSSSLPGNKQSCRPGKGKGKKRPGHKGGEQESWKHRTTVPEPFQMTLREAERRRRGIKTRSEIELENADLRRQLEELTECQMKFRASPVPAHVHLPLYEELQGRNKERRQATREREEQHLRTVCKPFSFLERERLKMEQRQLSNQPLSAEEKVKPFKAKPVPRAVYAAACGDLMKEEQLYRSIKMQMRAQELLRAASIPPSMLARRLNERKKPEEAGGENFSHRPRINSEVPDFDASYRRFQRHLEKRKEVKPTTACEPFELRTSQINSHHERILADIEKEQSSPRMQRWPHTSPMKTRPANTSLCSSLSGSLELLPTKSTDTTKKRHEAVRQVLEQRKKAEEEEEQWKERQKQKEKKLQRVVLKRAQAIDPHLALSQTQQNKLKEFRKHDRQRRKEYQQEIRAMQQRVKGRPLLLEQVAQRNAKQAAEKRYMDALHGCELTEEFVSSKALRARSEHQASPSSSTHSEDELDLLYEPVRYRKVFLDDDDAEVDLDKSEEKREEEEESEGKREEEEESEGKREEEEESEGKRGEEEESEGKREEEEEREGKREEEEESDRASSQHQDREDAVSQRSDKDSQQDDHCYSEDSCHYSDDHENDSNSEPDVDSRHQETEE